MVTFDLAVADFCGTATPIAPVRPVNACRLIVANSRLPAFERSHHVRNFLGIQCSNICGLGGVGFHVIELPLSTTFRIHKLPLPFANGLIPRHAEAENIVSFSLLTAEDGCQAFSFRRLRLSALEFTGIFHSCDVQKGCHEIDHVPWL